MAKPSESKKAKETTIDFDYIKSKQFRVIHVDGVHGGIAPKGNAIQMAMFSERVPIPRNEKYVIKNGKLGGRVSVEERGAIVREVEVEVIVDLAIAESIQKWLGEKIELAVKSRIKAK